MTDDQQGGHKPVQVPSSISPGSTDPHIIKAFLHYGYVPWAGEGTTRSSMVNWESVTGDPSLTGMGEAALVREGVRRLKALFVQPRGITHVVPLSGGLDSRAILAGLLDAGMRDQVVAVTFGIPGSWDYELGSRVARELNVAHELIDLRSVKVDGTVLRETASTGGGWTFLFDVVYNRDMSSRFGDSAAIWIGYLGDPVAGSHLPPQPSATWEEACQRFARWNTFVRSTVLTPPNFSPVEALPRLPLLAGSVLDYDEQLDFYLRQEQYVARVVIAPGCDVRLPFLKTAWLEFFYGVPRQLRLNKQLYRRILLEAFPKAFSLPTVERSGASLGASLFTSATRGALSGLRRQLDRRLWHRGEPPSLSRWWERRGIYRNINYLDFRRQIREAGALAETISSSLASLAGKGLVPWLDLDRLWTETKLGRADHGDALALLTALDYSTRVPLLTVRRDNAMDAVREGEG